MPNERDDWRMRHRGRHDERRWPRDERGDYGRFSPDEDGGGRGRSLWGGERDHGGWDRDDELRSVGSPGIGGGTGGHRDQDPRERERERDRGSARSEEWSPGQHAAERRSGGHAGKGPRNYQRSDERIREDVCDRLTVADDVDASEIDVQVEHGEVTMSGTTPTRGMKRRAEELAEGVAGVADVHNQLRVKAR